MDDHSGTLFSAILTVIALVVLLALALLLLPVLLVALVLYLVGWALSPGRPRS